MRSGGVLAQHRSHARRAGDDLGGVDDHLAVDYLDREAGDWRRTLGEERPAWLTPLIPRLGEELCRRINAAAALNPVNLVALVLLATPHHAIEVSLLERQLVLLADLQRRRPGGAHASLPVGTAAEWIDQVVALGMVERRAHSLGDILLADAGQAGLLAWYRNNVMHLFALAGLVAFAFRHRSAHRLEALEALLAPAWPILARELVIEPPASLREGVTEMLDLLVDDIEARRQAAIERGEITG